MGRSVVETLMGAAVLVVAGIFIVISYRSGNIEASAGDSYIVHAKFNEIGSLSMGSDVRIGGIKVGSVVDQSLDSQLYMAKLSFAIDNTIKLPKDSSAAVVSDGLLGGKYVAIIPGADDRMLKENEAIQYTQDAVSLEALIGKVAFGDVSGESDAEDDEDEL